MQAPGCCLVNPSSSSFGNAAATCMHSSVGFPKLLFGTFYKIQMGGRHLKQKPIAKVNNISALSTNKNSSLCIAEYRRNSSRPIRRKNKLRPKLLKTLPKPYIETLIQTDNSSKINLENIESAYKDDKKLEAETFSEEAIITAADETFIEEAIITTVDETFSGLNLQDGEAFINENKYVTDDDILEINAEKETLRKDSSLKDQLGKMWDSWKDWYTRCKKDILTWGVGNTPIFVVYESGEGEVKVSINEDEICNRYVAQPFGKDETRTTTLRLKIAEAKKLARCIERGVVKPPRNSTIYHFLDTGKEKGGLLGSAIYRATSNSVIGIGPAQPYILKNLQFGFLALSVYFFVWAAWKFGLRHGTFSAEKDKQKKKQLAIKSFKSSMDENRIGFETRILEIQDIAKRARMGEQNSSEENDYSNSKTMGTNTDDGRKEADQPLNFNVLRKNDHDLRDQDASDLNVLGGNGESTMLKEVNMHVRNNQLVQQGREGNSSISFREDGDRNGKSEKTQKPKVDVLQNGKSSAERAAHNATKETVNAIHTEKSVGEVKRLSQENFSVKGSRRIIPQVITGVKETREISVSKHGKRSNKSADASNTSNKSTSPVELVCTKQKSAITKEEISSHGRTVLRKNDHDHRDQDASDLHVLGGNVESTMPKEVNMHVQNTLLAQQGSEGNGSICFREDGDRNGNSEKPQQPKVDVLQDRQNSAERAADNATKETVNATHTEKGLGEVKRFSQKRSSVKGSRRITPQVITGVKEAREISVSKRGKHSNKSTDASNISNKGSYPVEPVHTKQKSAITKEEISSHGRIVRKRYKKLKPVVRKVENVFEEKIGHRKLLENVLANPLETAESKAKLDFGNTRDKRLQIEPENGVLRENDVLSQEAEELEWMRDEVLGKIVSRVQSNDNAGRGPSDGLVAEEELLFFRGLQRKYEREGESVKSWIKERVENLKYGKVLSGVDGPSMFSTIFSKDSTKEGKSIVSSKINKDHKMFTTEMGVDKENSSFISEPISISISSSLTSTDFSNMEINAKCKSHGGLDMALAKESIEYASFSAEGKLKNNKIVRAPEMVEQKKTVSKDNEYKQEMKKLLWWLDLPYLLCIALYRNNEDNLLKGLYSLEMAPVSESFTRAHHTIAFEDHADARNFCYILQSHFHELGDTSAHVIPLSTKDFYEEAKSTALKVTVIKKGELQLYVGQPLKEIERRIINIGSAMHNEKREDHDIDSYVQDAIGNKRSIAEQHRKQSE